MALENYLLELIAKEAAPLLVGQTAGRVLEPSATELAIALKRSDSICLFISLKPARPGLFITERAVKSLDSERAPGHFTNLLRKYITSATITKFVKMAGERQIRIDFGGYDTMGSALLLTLLIDLTGRSANAHLFVGDAYLASLRELPESAPPIDLRSHQVDRGDIKELTLAEFEAITEAAPLLQSAKRLPGFSPTLAQELAARAQTLAPYQAYQELIKEVNGAGQARIYAPGRLNSIKPGQIDASRNLFLTYIDLTIAAGLTENRFATLNEATDRYFDLLARVDQFVTRRNALQAKLKNEIAKLATLLGKLKDEQAEYQHADEYRKRGDLILANLATLRREHNRIYLIDLYDPAQPEIVIEADSNATPQMLAESYFKKYQKARRGQQAVESRIAGVEKDLARKRDSLTKLSSALSEEELIPFEARPLPKTVKPPVKKGDKTKDKTAGLRRYLSSDGFEILVGRSDATNEQLTFQIAKPADIWLHAADYPGSHVVVRNPQRRAVPQKTIIEAAQLAAYFSKAREDRSVAVRYTERKHVTRPKKSKPGLALLTQFKTLMVTPQELSQRIL